jgi:hypothetical protein
MSSGSFSERANRFIVPAGTTPSAISPFQAMRAAAEIVPSPPPAISASTPGVEAARSMVSTTLSPATTWQSI